jgi:hypothetical protein
VANSLATFTKTIDNYFTETWYEIKPDAIDNILLATVIWAVLKNNGCFDEQVGGTNVEETIKYGVGPSAIPIVKGDLLGQGEVETETAAFWTFRNISTHIQRSTIQDTENNGKFQIKNYVKKRTTEAMDALKQSYETDLFNVGRTSLTDESGKYLQSLNEMVPSFNNKSAGTYGGISRASNYVAGANGVQSPSGGTNPWWGNIYKAITTPPEVNLLSDMKSLYNSIGLNQDYPDLILSSQNLFEIYEEFALDQVQIIKDQSTYLADLGFEVLRFKGNPLVWTPNISMSPSNTNKNTMTFLNTKWIKVVYDPNLWFDMTEWKPIPQQQERLAHILCRACMYSPQPRRHGRLYGHADDGI